MKKHIEDEVDTIMTLGLHQGEVKVNGKMLSANSHSEECFDSKRQSLFCPDNNMALLSSQTINIMGIRTYSILQNQCNTLFSDDCCG